MDIRREYLKCKLSAHYFIHTYCQIEDPPTRRWIPFHLWPAQSTSLQTITDERFVIALKARQLGLTWLCVAHALWTILFRPGSIVLFFSRRDDEAAELLDRIKDMHARLPQFLQASIGTSNEHEFQLPRLGSVARSFPTTKHSGRSFTATLAIVDEADFIPWLRQLLAAVKPTVEAGGQLIIVSTSNKDKPQSEFKRVWREAIEGLNRYEAIFLPWSAHPDRDETWYQNQAADLSEDDLHQEYPATPEQALSQRGSSKRFHPDWISQCYEPSPALQTGPPIPGLIVYREPSEGASYLIAVDTSEGDPNSDPSPATVFRADTWEEIAHLWGTFEPTALAGYLCQLAHYYNDAIACVERNNHGHAVHVALRALNNTPPIYRNPFDNKDGWLSNVKYKTLAIDNTAQVLREGGCLLHTEAIKIELAGIEAATLKAPEGEHDDRAMTVIIGLAALRWPSASTTPASTLITPPTMLEENDFA